jgi:hypothetical protein
VAALQQERGEARVWRGAEGDQKIRRRGSRWW